MNDPLLDHLAATPRKIRSLVEGLCETELSHKPADDVFSLRENVLHVRDIELEGYEQRVVLLLSELEPLLRDVDGAALARERDYNSQPVAPALAAFETSRAGSLVLLAEAKDEDLERTGTFEGVGVVTLRQLLELWLEHDESHVRDMEALRAGRQGRTSADAA
jgi:hypothetical protein